MHSSRWRDIWRDSGAILCYNRFMAYEPKYTITDSILARVAEIESIKTKVDSSYVLPEREIEMRHRATVEATHSSTSIEGNSLDYKQVERALSTTTALTRHQYAELEVRNYGKALDFVNKRKKISNPITLQDILKLHNIIMEGLLLGDKIGKLRKNDAYVINQDDIVQYIGPEAGVVSNELQELLNWLNDTSRGVHPIIGAGLLHFQFVSIHPFSDGNGRTTRALTTLYLGLRDYDLRGSLVLDSYYSVGKQEYYSALHDSQGNDYTKAATGDVTNWLEYFTTGFLSSAKILLTEITLISSVIGDIPARINHDEADILAYAKQFGAVSLSDAEGILPHIARRTLQRKLSSLVDQGYLRLEGKARNIVYSWNREKNDKGGD